MAENPFLVNLTREVPSRSSTPSLKYCSSSVEDTVRELQTDSLKGLSDNQDIAYRRNIHGTNELTEEEDEHIAIKFVKTFYEDKLILLLIGSAAVSFWMGNTDDAVSITLAIFIVVSVGFVQEYRSEKSLEALNQLIPAEAHLTRNGSTQTVLASTLVPGDLVHFSVGDRVPADIRVTEAVHLSIDESNLTGENNPVFKNIDAIRSSEVVPVTGRESIAFMGTLVRDGHGSGIVVATGSLTEFGTVFAMMSEIEKPKTPLQNTMDKLGEQLSLFSFVVIGIICLIGVIQGRSWLDMFQISVSLAVAAIPEGLPIIVTVTLALGVLRMARHKAIVRRLPSVETLGSVNVICSDKTGTLTQNHMTVTQVWSVDMKDVPLDVHKALSQPLTRDITTLLEVSSICNNARYSPETERYVGNPTDIALVECLPHFCVEDMRGTRERVNELPFSSLRKYMAVCAHSGDKSKCETFTKGAIEKILEKCVSYYDKAGKPKPLDEKTRAQINDMAETLASKGLRVIALAKCAGTFTTEPSDMVFAGLVGMNDPPRPSVRKAIARLMRGGVHVIMITGDSQTTAVNVAKQIGMPINDPRVSVMTGDKLDSMSEEALAAAISNVSVFARTTPEHKVAIVRALQRRGDIVAMTGDGVNDAPALKLADIGISMGKMGTDVAKEASDMVLTDDDFSTILNAIEEGKGIFYNIQNFLTFQLSTSIAALSLIALSTLLKLPNPLNAMQILWINILMDGPPAQSLGVEPVDPEVMNKPPRSRNDKILTTAVIKRLLQSAATIITGTMFVYMREMKDEITARDTTMTFTCFVMFDMFNALACRHNTKSIFSMGMTNSMFNFAVAGSLIGQLCAIYVPFFQRIFQTEALSAGDLLFLLCITSTVFIGDEIRKFLSKSNGISSRYSYNV
ncbi:hypothetical protein BABINDRAFT_159232 [Babjeviella inositovora NRRL Y-12698]|uniref:Calcium-transporting ATPase n=1 Tax=Babjeviella inositovora NRRL Y-12698 TaxID=984486 RepID=A0A1E3R029_9ASCO|nr:uncharacterized protein BABINDRAFT_159232 [Babjeviella inositovora NRRL Y-12698]ODQ82707.1 hypothetical protein BABINDRAFT_159232 [Babjeviella inositovora NRRL Y-12698]